MKKCIAKNSKQNQSLDNYVSFASKFKQTKAELIKQKEIKICLDESIEQRSNSSNNKIDTRFSQSSDIKKFKTLTKKTELKDFQKLSKNIPQLFSHIKDLKNFLKSYNTPSELNIKALKYNHFYSKSLSDNLQIEKSSISEKNIDDKHFISNFIKDQQNKYVTENVKKHIQNINANYQKNKSVLSKQRINLFKNMKNLNH